ncbi:MAG TPA: alpha/beta hydrolase [Gammaproteobacteria bacterium]|nr:alpha/beta hydrolase [Gammaproteobacteria bacterium]
MKPALRNELRAFGRDLVPQLLDGTHKLFTELHGRIEPGAAAVTRDLRYGPDERHRLDLFRPKTQSAGAKAPMLLFVHGGGFIMGDKSLPGMPFYDNVGRWAAASGFVGATMTYRLAPAHPWPAGAEDVGRAVQWLAAHAAEHGGDSGKIFLMGQSAGAVHAASYLAFPRFQEASRPGVAGAALISGIYDIPSAHRNDFQDAYFGTDAARFAGQSSLPGLVGTNVPLLFSVSELDGEDFHRQAALVVSGFMQAGRGYPRMLYLQGHNHLSSVLQMGLPEDSLGPQVASFVEAVASGSAE